VAHVYGLGPGQPPVARRCLLVPPGDAAAAASVPAPLRAVLQPRVAACGSDVLVSACGGEVALWRVGALGGGGPHGPLAVGRVADGWPQRTPGPAVTASLVIAEATLPLMHVEGFGTQPVSRVCPDADTGCLRLAADGHLCIRTLPSDPTPRTIKVGARARRGIRVTLTAERQAHVGAVTALLWCGTARRPLLASGGSDGCIRLWDIKHVALSS
jgi:hypothetical protein